MVTLIKKALKMHRRYKVLVTIAVVILGISAAIFWKHSNLSLPEPVVVLPEVVGGPEPPAVTAGLDKYDILLLGLDFRENEPELGQRTDTILLLTIDPNEAYGRVLSIPRDTRVRYGERWIKINEVFSIDGSEGSVKAVNELLMMNIDRYAVIDFDGVIELVDLLGGITVDVPVRMYKPLENIDLQPGLQQELNGYDTLAYMRYRDERLSDMDRSERQKEVLFQLADKLLQPVNLLKLPSLASTALRYVETDLGFQEILSLAKYGRTIMNNGVENQVLPGINDRLANGGWYYIPFLEEIGLPMGEAEQEYQAFILEREAMQIAEAARIAQEEAELALEEAEDNDMDADNDIEDTEDGTGDVDVDISTEEEAETDTGEEGEMDADDAYVPPG